MLILNNKFFKLKTIIELSFRSISKSQRIFKVNQVKMSKLGIARYFKKFM